MTRWVQVPPTCPAVAPELGRGRGSAAVVAVRPGSSAGSRHAGPHNTPASDGREAGSNSMPTLGLAGLPHTLTSVSSLASPAGATDSSENAAVPGGTASSVLIAGLHGTVCLSEHMNVMQVESTVL